MAGRAVAELNFDQFGILSTDMDSGSRPLPRSLSTDRTPVTGARGKEEEGEGDTGEGAEARETQGYEGQKRQRTGREDRRLPDWEQERVAWLREDAPLRPPQDPDKSIEYHLGKAPVPRSFRATHIDANGVKIRVLSEDHPFSQQHGSGGVLAWISLPRNAARVQAGESSPVKTVGGDPAGDIVYLSTHFYGPMRRGWAEIEIGT